MKILITYFILRKSSFQLYDNQKYLPITQSWKQYCKELYIERTVVTNGEQVSNASDNPEPDIQKRGVKEAITNLK